MADAKPLSTLQEGWETLRATVSADDTLLSASATTMKNANIPSYAFTIPKEWNTIEISFNGDTAADAFVANIYAARKGGDIVHVCTTGTLTVGTQALTASGRLAVDTLASITSYWPSITIVDGGADNKRTRLILDSLGYEKWICQFTGLSSESAGAEISGY